MDGSASFIVPRPKRYQWPKALPPITAEQIAISNDWMKTWHEMAPGKFSVFERFNHEYVLRHLPAQRPFRTIEVGAGIGGQLEYEDLSMQEYHCIELRENMASEIMRRYPGVTATVADCQTRIPYPDAHFDRAISVQVFEHLPNLPGAIAELARVLKPGGICAVVIPCDPGLAYEVARQLSAARMFRKKYKIPYGWYIRREHVNSPNEVLSVLNENMREIHRSYFPLGIPIKNANLCLGLTFLNETRTRGGR